MRIHKHMVEVAGRRVHYLRAGRGPALVLLHASACSAKVMRPLIEIFAQHFTVIAPDTPGFGLSHKLQVAEPSVENFADALADTLAALGIGHAAVYGRHTGASIAVEFAVRHPARSAMVLTDGYPLLSGDYDAAKLAQYLQPILPRWDGGHLTWLWFRYRDQHAFWPWNAQALANRADTDIPDLDFLHRGVIEFLEAGDDYRLGYAAPFRHDALGAFARLRVPACFGTRPGDWLHRQVRMYPPGTWHEEMPREAMAAAAKELAILRLHPARGEPPPAPRGDSVDFVDIGDADVLVRRVGDLGAAPPLVILHHAPGSSALYEQLLFAVGAAQPVLALDLPGHGESDPLPGNPQTVEAWADATLRVLDALGIATADLYGQNGGAAVAVEAARRAPARVRSLVLDAPIVLGPDDARVAENYAPDVMPSWEGAHLLRAWHHLRDQELWWPWFDRRREAIRAAPPRIDPAALTLRLRESLKQPASHASAWRAALGYPLAERLRGIAQPVMLLCALQDVFAPLFAAASSACPSAQAIEIDDTAAARAAALRDWLPR